MRFNITIKYLTLILVLCLPLTAQSKNNKPHLHGTSLATSLNWRMSNKNFCGGYYVDPPFAKGAYRSDNHIEISGNEGTFSFLSTSVGKGKITIARTGQQIIADQLKIYRNKQNGNLRKILLKGNVSLREPGTLLLGKEATVNLSSHTESMKDVSYRSTLSPQAKIMPKRLKKARTLKGQVAFGQAKFFKKISKGVLNFTQATYSTCPPIMPPAWQLHASHVHLDKNTGRGTATHARVLIHGVPILYSPWLSFPIDSRRKTGFLPMSLGTSGKSGAWFSAPFYWNIAPNYDATITPSILSKRGIKFSNLFRYLTPKSSGNILIDIVPDDRTFKAFQDSSNAKFQNNSNSAIQAELRRLNQASTTRSAIKLHNETYYNEHWSSSINYNRVSDDYYLRDLTNNLNEITENQLLQEAQFRYEGQYWNFTGGLQGYQALHPLNEVSSVENQYARLPQLSVNGNYPDGPLDFNLFTQVEFTRFALQPTPGTQTLLPEGSRLHLQPGFSRRLENSWFFLEPRLQYSMTQYRLSHTTPPLSNNPTRFMPIFDTRAGIYLDRDFKIKNHSWQQTLEPQIYYVYIPFRNQNNLPLFDTSASTLSYDQLFINNRFNGIDRIGDANQISLGITTRIKDKRTSTEKLSASIGQIFYFKNREINLGDSTTNDTSKTSPITGRLTWDISTAWKLNADSIWDVRTNAFNNQTLSLAYNPKERTVVNLGYSFIRQGDVQIGDAPNSPASNLSQTDLSFQWPISDHLNTVGRWTHNWNHHHFQNLLYGLEYDSCCWAVRFVASRAFTGLNPAGTTFMYENSFSIQFALKGLGNIGNNDPSQLLNNSITGYQSNFGQQIT